MTFYVSNLSAATTREDLLQAFRAHGDVESVNLPGDRMKDGRAHGPHRGFAFVVMRDRAGAPAALSLDGRAMHGTAMSVRVAHPKRTPHYVS